MLLKETTSVESELLPTLKDTLDLLILFTLKIQKIKLLLPDYQTFSLLVKEKNLGLDYLELRVFISLP